MYIKIKVSPNFVVKFTEKFDTREGALYDDRK